MKALVQKSFQFVVLIVIGLLTILTVDLLLGEPQVHAYPEYATRTDESCATCHVNPGGGGPRTLRGLLWAAQGRPDQVPILGDILIAPGVTNSIELYDIACASCHGSTGEGLFGGELANSGIPENSIRSTILRGRERSGMPAFEGQFSAEQLQILVEYVTGMASGEIEPAPISYPLPPGKFECLGIEFPEPCGRN